MKQSATRRLVKSPPELWAEVSSEDSLSRHLSEFGEIKITRVKPETTVAWEGDRASGTVELAPTGWGTKVILTATPAKGEVAAAPTTVSAAEPPAEAVLPAEPAAQVEPAPRAVLSAEPAAQVEAAPLAALPAEPAAEQILSPAALRSAERARQAAARAAGSAAAEPRPAPPPIDPRPQAGRSAPVPAPEEQRGFFSRFFRKRPAETGSIPAPPAPAPDPAPPTPTPQPGPLPPAPDPVPPTPAPQPPAPPQIKALDPERTAEILSEVLDDLGAAHHRPFSRDRD